MSKDLVGKSVIKKQMVFSSLPDQALLPGGYRVRIICRRPVTIDGGGIYIPYVCDTTFTVESTVKVTIRAAASSSTLQEYIAILMWPAAAGENFEIFACKNSLVFGPITWAASTTSVNMAASVWAASLLDHFFTSGMVDEISISRLASNTWEAGAFSHYITRVIFEDNASSDLFTLQNPLFAAGGGGTSAANFGMYWKAPTFNSNLVAPVDGDLTVYGDSVASITYLFGTIRLLTN